MQLITLISVKLQKMKPANTDRPWATYSHHGEQVHTGATAAEHTEVHAQLHC